MKLNIAFRVLLASICTTSRAGARVASRLRDPRTVERKDEEVHRQTMGDHFLVSRLNKVTADGITCKQRMDKKEKDLQDTVNDLSLEEAKSLACTAVSTDYPDCKGCQGFSKVGKEIHAMACVDMTPDECKVFAEGIVDEKPGWFKDGVNTSLQPETHEFVGAGQMSYYKLGLPVSANDHAPQGSKLVTGVAGNCMVHYSWDWCVPSSSSSNGDSTVCLKLQPWDCSGGADGGCLTSSECCAKIQGQYPKPDINGNELQCYEWVLPVKSGGGPTGPTSPSDSSSGNTGSSGGHTGNRLVMHVKDGKVALPAVITDGTYEPVHDEEIIETQPVCPKSFPDKSTLQRAAIAYIAQDCASNSNCAIGEEWGYPINSWCVEQVTNFNYIFGGLSTFNEDVNGWTTSQVINMNVMFYNARAFNQPLDNWDTSSVTHMYRMFYRASAFNQNLCQWGDHYDSGVDNRSMFRYTACPNTGSPTSAKGPWCHVCP